MAQLAMPDNVCIGTVKHYYVDPVLGSTYTWRINGVLQGSTANAIDITWNTIGTYSLDVQEKSVDGCLGQLRSGEVFVTPLPSAPVTGTITQPTCGVATGGVVLNGLPATGTWTLTRTPGGTTTTGTGTSTTITGLTAATTFTYTVTDGVSLCTSAASGNVVIATQPIKPSVTNQTTSMLTGTSFTVTPGGVPDGTTYTWPAPTYTGGVTGGSAQSTGQSNISGSLTIPTGTGTAIYIVTPTSGACIGATFTVTVTVSSSCTPVTIGTQPADNSMCTTSGNASFTVVASGSAPFTYQWQYNNSGTWANVANGTPAGALYTNATTATMSVAGNSSAGSPQYRCYVTNCTGATNATSNAVTLTVNPLPTANAGTDGNACDLNFILSAVPSIGTGTWTKLSGPGSATFTPDANQPGAKVTVDQSGTYYFTWAEMNGTCQSTDVVRVVFRSLPAVSAGKDTTICISDNIQLQGVGTGSFSWEPAVMIINPKIKNPVAALLSTTEFIVTLTDQYGCKNSDTVLVSVLDLPIAYAGPDLVLEYLFGASLEATEPGANETGRWSLISGSGVFNDTTSALTDVNELSLGENILLWKVRNGVCPPSDDYLSITVNNLVIPTLITPNMDGKNDYFVLRGIETLGKTELTIFDRRGALVYKNSNYDNSWNGVDYNDRPLLDDTYFFVIKSEKGKSFSGYIVVRR
jgi:gliding motility-associated-like protein